MSLALVRTSLVDNLKECETHLKDAQEKIDALRYDTEPVQDLQEATQKLVEDVEQLTEDIEQVITQDLESRSAEEIEDVGNDRTRASTDTEKD